MKRREERRGQGRISGEEMVREKRGREERRFW